MADTDVVSQGYDMAAVWRWVDELTAELTMRDRNTIRDAITDHMLQGWRPNCAADVTDLLAYATGTMSMAHYLTLVQHNRPART